MQNMSEIELANQFHRYKIKLKKVNLGYMPMEYSEFCEIVRYIELSIKLAPDLKIEEYMTAIAAKMRTLNNYYKLVVEEDEIKCHIKNLL